MRNSIHASDLVRRGRSTESTLRKVAMWPVRMAKKAVTLLSIHTSSWFVGLTASWGETNYIALAKACMANPYTKRAYDLIADNMSSIALKAIAGEGEDAEERPDHPFLQVLKRPNDETGYQGFVQKIVAHLMFGGELFFYAPESPLTGQNAGVPRPGRRWELIRPDRILDRLYADDGSDTLVGYRVAPKNRRGREQRIPAGRIKHIKLYNPYDEDRGMPMVLSVWRQIQLMEDSDEWNKSVAESKGRSPGFFKFKGEGPMNDTQFERTKEQLQESYAKDQRHSKPGLLDGDFDWISAGVTQKDMDWLKGDMANGRKIAIGLGVDPSLLGDQGSRTLANLNEGLRHLMLLRVLPMLEWLLDEWNHYYMAPQGDAELMADADNIEALQEDRNQKATRLGGLVENGLLTINEARGDLGQDARDEPEANILWKPFSREPLTSPDGDDLPDDFDQLADMDQAEFQKFVEQLPGTLSNLFEKKQNGRQRAA